MERSRQLWAIVLLLALTVFIGAGCGGGDPATTTVSQGGSTPTSGATTPTGVDTTDEGVDMIGGVPAEFATSFGERPIVVLFYVPGGVEDERVLKTLKELRSSFSDYTFLMYDYSVPDAYGDLSKDLHIAYQPQVVMIDRSGITQYVWSGFVDKGSLNQSLVNLGRY